MVRLPLDPKALASELSQPLAVRDKRRLDVTFVSLVRSRDSDSLRLELTVLAIPVPGAAAEHWRVAIPVSPEDLDPEILPASFVVTVRANLEEWWDTKGADPFTSKMGQRLFDPDDQPESSKP
jgi:hypothetical protein